MKTNRNKNQKKSYVNTHAILRFINLIWIWIIIISIATLLFTLDIKVNHICLGLLSFYTGCITITFLCCCIVYSITHSLVKPIFWCEKMISIFSYVFGTIFNILIIIFIAIFMISVLHLKHNMFLLFYTIVMVSLILQWMIIIISCGCTFALIGAVLCYIIKLLPISYIIKVNYIKKIIKLVNLLTKFKLYSKLIELKKITCYNVVKISKKFVKLEKKTCNKFKRIFRKVKGPTKIFIKNITAILIKNVVYYFLLLISILASREFYNVMKELKKINFIIGTFTGFNLYSIFEAIFEAISFVWNVICNMILDIDTHQVTNADQTNVSKENVSKVNVNGFFPDVTRYEELIYNIDQEGQLTKYKETLEYAREEIRLDDLIAERDHIPFTYYDNEINNLQVQIDNISAANERAINAGTYLSKRVEGLDYPYDEVAIDDLKTIQNLCIANSTKLKYWEKNVHIKRLFHELDLPGTANSSFGFSRIPVDPQTRFQRVAQRQHIETSKYAALNDEKVLEMAKLVSKQGNSVSGDKAVLRHMAAGLYEKASRIKQKVSNIDQGTQTKLEVTDIKQDLNLPNPRKWSEVLTKKRKFDDTGIPESPFVVNPSNKRIKK